MIEPNSQEFTKSFSHLSKDSLLLILQDSLKKQQSLKLQNVILEQQLSTHQEQLNALKKRNLTEKDSCLMMMYAQQRNVDKIDQLQKAVLRFGNKYQQNIPSNKQNEFQWKYRELKRHLQLYINNSNQVQEELLEGCKKSKREREMAYREYEKEAYLSEQYRLKCTALEITIASKDNEILKLSKQLKEAMRSLENSQFQQHFDKKAKEQKHSTDRYEKQQQQLRSWDFRYTGLSKERDILNGQIDDLKQLNDQLKHENNMLKETVNKLQEYNKGLLGRLIEQPAVSQSITERNLIQTWSIEVKRLKKQVEELNAKIQKLIGENKAMVSSKTLLQQKIKILQVSNQEILKQNLTLSSELRLACLKQEQRVPCFNSKQRQQEETEGESTIMTSMQMNWVQYNGRKIKNFLSYQPPK